MKLPRASYIVPCAYASVALLALFAACSPAQDCPAEEPASDKPAAEGEKDETDAKTKHTNRLAKESSPYLLLHAHNPVDWYPWGEEALAKANKENKVIFLSVGYSSCHWCHVMERESFIDKEIAAFLNKHFICIKVDREERPDIDSFYMTSLQVYNQLSGSGRGGGWPMSMFLLPDTRPFFGGTYFPARDGDRGATTGFFSIAKRIQEIWKENPDAIKRDAESVARLTKVQLEGEAPDESFKISKDLIDKTLASLDDQYDETYGGFGFNESQPNRPKFPEPSNLFFLADHVRNTKDERAKEMLVGTLERMSMGGIQDHLGGGFHRYSVDRFWRIPHYEKMLYDNGQLASVYAETYTLTGREDFRRIVEEMLEFVLRELTSEEGGFYSALDAESEDEEGKYYRWEKKEVQSVLDKDEYELFASVYGLDSEPNFEEHYYAPQFAKPLSEIAADLKVDEAKLVSELTPIRKKLFDARSKRERPLLDIKILTSWNGLMIRGFADAGRELKNDSYIKAAERAADFVLDKLRNEDGRLLRTYANGEAKLNAYLNDYAYLVDGLIALYRASGDKKWLTAADELTAKQIELFWDEKNGGFFFTSSDHEALLARSKNPVDGAQPSGNSVSAQNLIFLAKELKKPDYLDKAKKTVRSSGTLLQRSPSGAPRMVIAASQLIESKE